MGSTYVSGDLMKKYKGYPLPEGFMVILGELCYRGWRIAYHLPNQFSRASKHGVSVSARDLWVLKRVLDERKTFGYSVY